MIGERVKMKTHPVLGERTTYITGDQSVSFLARSLPSAYFYWVFVRIVLRSSSLAKKGTYGEEAWIKSSIEVLRHLERVGVSVELSGADHISAVDSPVIFIGNHLSVLETVILPAFIVPFRSMTYVIKQSLLEYPIFKHVMRSRDPIAVSRTNPRQDLKTVLAEGQERLAQNMSIMIFPQTTRTAFDPAQFSSIGIKLAKKAGVPVVPLALKTDAWENGKRFKDFGRINPKKRVYFAFGAPLEIRGKGTEEHQQIIDFIQGKLAQWHSQDQ